MSSYKNHYREPARGECGWQLDLDWTAFTARRLAWLYGPLHASERYAQTQRDVAAWNRLGSDTRSAA